MTTDAVRDIAAAKWSIDLAHSSVHFKVRHMAIAWVRGDLRILNATIWWGGGEKLEELRIEADLDPASVNTGQAQRDQHLRDETFLDVEHFPSIRFQSTQVSRDPGATAIRRSK